MADWQPLVTDPARRAELVAVIGEIVDAVPRPDDISNLLDRAITRAYLAQDDTVPDPDDEVGSSLTAAVTAFATTPTVPALFGGACGVGWTTEHLAGGDVAARVCDAVDRALLGRLDDWTADYDLVAGLVGFGVYGLERGDAGRSVVSRVIDHLERTAQPSHGGLAWHTRVELLSDWQREVAPDGYWNLGLAHGIPGVIGFLARCVKHAAEPRARALLDAAMTYLLAVIPAPSDGSSRFPSWLPETRFRRRTAWCYGDLGVALCILAAAQACERDDWRHEALELARNCAGDDETIRDAGLCHGTAGAVQLFARLWNATGEPVFADAARRWIDRTFAIRRNEPHAGFPALSADADGDRWVASSSILTGAPGVALALHAAISEVEPTWDRMMLLDV